MERDPTSILEALAALDSEEDPTLNFLLSRHPELACMDWINRWGPHHAWPPILAKFSTPQLAYLAKVITVLERDLKWIGGSVAATIWIFRSYRRRGDSDVDALASWIVDNGTNPWSPWGSQCYARTLSEFERQHETKRAKRIARLEFEAQQRQRKEEDKLLAQKAVMLRCAQGKERRERVRVYLSNLEAMDASERLTFLVRDESFPLEVIPPSLIAPSLIRVHEVPAEIRSKLLLRLDRRKARRWRKLRAALTF